jgi:hypothetical protein
LQLLGKVINGFFSDIIKPSPLTLSICHRLTFTGFASFLIFPQDMASSGWAPLSEPSNSLAVLMKTEKSAPFL